MPFFGWGKNKKQQEIVNDSDSDDIQALIELRHQNDIENKIVKLQIDLVVDDNSINYTVLSRYLKKAGYDSVYACNGYDALKMLVSKNYTLIWLDVKMPILDGYHTVKYLRQEYPKGFGYTGTIIGVTGFADEDSQQKCIKSGMNYILAKPYAYDSIDKLHYRT